MYYSLFFSWLFTLVVFPKSPSVSAFTLQGYDFLTPSCVTLTTDLLDKSRRGRYLSLDICIKSLKLLASRELIPNKAIMYEHNLSCNGEIKCLFEELPPLIITLGSEYPNIATKSLHDISSNIYKQYLLFSSKLNGSLLIRGIKSFFVT